MLLKKQLLLQEFEIQQLRRDNLKYIMMTSLSIKLKTAL